jgi:hypothetical protein
VSFVDQRWETLPDGCPSETDFSSAQSLRDDGGGEQQLRSCFGNSAVKTVFFALVRELHGVDFDCEQHVCVVG